MYLLNNIKINIYDWITGPDGAQYPPRHFLDQVARETAGVVEAVDPVWPDPELFHASENPDGSLTITPLTESEIADRAAAAAARAAARVPQEVTRFQARAALHGAGLLEPIEAMMADPQTPMLTKLAWQDAQTFKRQSPTVLTLAGALGLSSAALDQLFTTASGIEA